MLLGIQISKNGRKFLHPNIKHPHFGHTYIIQRSKQLSNAAQSLSRPADRQRSGTGMPSTETIQFDGITCISA